MVNSVHQAVMRQYEKWVYPQPIMDLAAPEQQGRWDGGDPTKRYHTYWPHRDFRDDLNILVAGCGSNAAARYAFHHPQATITGIDLSTSSLAHEAYLKDKHQLSNLTLHQCPLEEVASLGQTFDFIDVSGVLHHLPDPVTGLKALGTVLNPDGVIAVMLYGKYGRTGVYMMQELFTLMGLTQTEADLDMVKTTLKALPQSHVVNSYLGRTQDTRYDAGLVDTFLHPQDRAYSTQDCLQFVEDAGLQFMGWWDNILYYPEAQISPDSVLAKKLNTLPEADIWSAMELYNGTLGQHSFCVCLPQRPESTYKPDFEGEALLGYVPVRQCQVVEDAGEMIRVERKPYPVYTLTPAVSEMFRQIDGVKTVAQCFEASGFALPEGYTMHSACREVFRYLWRLSHITLKMPQA